MNRNDDVRLELPGEGAVQDNSDDLKDICKVGREVLQPSDVEAFQLRTLALLEQTLGSDKGNFFLTRLPDCRIDYKEVRTRGVEERYFRLYRRYYRKLDPFAKRDLETTPTVMTTEDVVSYRNLVRTEYYNDFLKPQSIHHQMVIHLRVGRRLLGAVALFRSRSRREFTDRERGKAEMIAPYLLGGLEKAAHCESSRLQKEILHMLSRDLPYQGVLILDPSMQLVYHNDSALDILAFLRRGETPSAGRLLPREIELRCERLLTGTDPDADRLINDGDRSSCDIADPRTGQRVSLLFRLIPDPDRTLLLVGLRPETELACLGERLRKHGLTTREIDVVSLASEGLRNAEIAERLFISAHTVDNHLKSVYRKLGVRSRALLVRHIMQMQNPPHSMVC
ncbi:MAG: helix-turn-helix transcriptional regulator [Desulfobacteraceae bacterium]|jgi:DNA-binding CsgD family transcriptional regulator